MKNKELDQLVIDGGLDALRSIAPFTSPIDWSTVTWFEEKADGSLISTFLHKGELCLKSKTSLSSHQALDAMKWLDCHIDLKLAMKYFAERGFTTIMEWCDPDPKSRIVLFYDKPQLRVFGIRCMNTGNIIDYRQTSFLNLVECGLIDEIDDCGLTYLNTIIDHSVFRKKVDDPESFALNVPNEEGVEGYIMVNENGYRTKIKTQWYITQHRLKDSVTNEKALFACAVTGSTDDLKSIFHDNPGAIKVITEMEEFVEPLYAQFVHDVEAFYTFNQDLDRKSYAIKGQVELSPQQFHCAMSLYLGKNVDYDTVLIKNTDLYLTEYRGGVVEIMEE